jgi:hypothetical protein
MITPLPSILLIIGLFDDPSCKCNQHCPKQKNENKKNRNFCPSFLDVVKIQNWIVQKKNPQKKQCPEILTFQ